MQANRVMERRAESGSSFSSKRIGHQAPLELKLKPLSIAVLIFLAFACVAFAAEPQTIDFTGHYELVTSAKNGFSLDVQQKGKSAEVGFSAGNVDGSGAAPDGGGKGKLNAKGELQFEWTDSFENSGTAVLRRDGKTYRLSMKPTKVEDSRALVHYGNLTLKRTSTKPQTDDR